MIKEIYVWRAEVSQHFKTFIYKTNVSVNQLFVNYESASLSKGIVLILHSVL